MDETGETNGPSGAPQGAPGSASFAERKIALRGTCASARALAASLAPDAGQRLARHGPSILARWPDLGGPVGAYVPIRSEIDPQPLARALLEAFPAAALSHPAASLALPVVRGKAMRFVAHEPGAPLTAGPMGTREPRGPTVRPTLLLVPLLAFTRSGHRLGYGGGYYDRYLAAHPRTLALGVAFAAQERAALPVEAHDVPLHGVVTEVECIFGGIACG